MKKALLIAAAAGLAFVSTAAYAGEIDPAGKTVVGIAAPARAIERNDGPQVVFDSAGRSTAAAFAGSGERRAAPAEAGKRICLDSECRVRLF